MNSGNNTLLFSVTDNTTLVNVTGHNAVHFTNVSWTLNKSGTLKASEIKAQERRFSIYPNPANREFYIRGKQDFAKNAKVVLYDGSGKLIPVKYEMKDASTLFVDINNLLIGTYTLAVTQDNELIISQKISKE